MEVLQDLKLQAAIRNLPVLGGTMSKCGNVKFQQDLQLHSTQVPARVLAVVTRTTSSGYFCEGPARPKTA